METNFRGTVVHCTFAALVVMAAGTARAGDFHWIGAGTGGNTATDPADPTRKATDTASVQAAELSEVTGISIEPKVFSTSTTFRIIAEPEGAKADKITVTIYDLLGKKVDEVSRENTDSVTWDGGSLRNGAYIYVAVVEDENLDVPFVHRGFVYIKR